ncbi:pyruvate kinase alpha/beta domain-containing protein [Bradyrhizobium sp. LA6.7]|uniref:pyruvate kinase alpha/beta domain-containing protein n=1 Tax=unclassified Bradyrhizobium TaxID=2631580 RepID=UPI003390E533
MSRRLCLTSGARSVCCSEIGSYEEMIERETAQAILHGLAICQDTVVIVAGIPFGFKGSTNNLRACLIQ